MRILVSLKHSVDPDQLNRLRLSGDGKHLDYSNVDRYVNPFDEYALETALRLTENGENPHQRLGEVVAVSFGDENSEVVLRGAMALGASRAIRVAATDDDLDAQLVARGLVRLAQHESVDLVLLGKQSVDGDGHEVAQRVAAILDWPQVTGVAAIEEQQEGTLIASREVDCGILQVRTRAPAVVSVDLRVVLPSAVRSRHTPREFEYPAGVRFASLPSIIGAKRKRLDVHPLSALLGSTPRVLSYTSYQLAPARQDCEMVHDVDELLSRLAERAPAVLAKTQWIP